MKKTYWMRISSIAFLCLSACSQTTVKYNPEDFVNPNRIVTKEVEKPVLPSVRASYGIGNDPAVVKAYQHYQKTGEMQTVHGDGWITFPYSEQSKPIIACSMFHFCIIELESGEKLNSYGIGNTQDWQSNAFLTGEGPTASISIQLKPIRQPMATDLTISTNKRTYLIGLVAKSDASTSVLRFYYPEETKIASIQHANQLQQTRVPGAEVISATPISGTTEVHLEHVNFNYQIKGDQTPWRPLRVFDDGNKTFIQLPAMADKFSLPVVYLARHKEMQMVNSRYQKPYFVIDGLFSRAWLVSGKGSDQERIEILNQNIQS